MTATVHVGDARAVLATLPTGSARCIVTSPPYFGLRDYGVDGQIGLEPTPDEFVAALVAVFREARRVLANDGTLWLNLGDTYASPMKGGGGTGKSGLMRDGRPDAGRGSVDQAQARQAYAPRQFDISAAGLKPKDLIGVPWRAAFALQADGWYLRSDIIWSKPNPMPESITDRPTKAHEYVFLLAKSERYYYDHEAVKEPITESSRERAKYSRVGHSKDVYGDGITNLRNPRTDQDSRRREIENGDRNKRTVWTVATRPYSGAHFATFPPDLIRPCVQAGTEPGDTVLDPFNGAGTTGLVALEHGRNYVGIELNPEYVSLTEKRLAPLLAQPSLFEVTS